MVCRIAPAGTAELLPGVSELARVEHDNVGLEIPETHSLALLGLFHPSRDRKASTMRRSIMLASAASLAVALSAPAHSQGAPQTVTLMKVDPQTLATGYRTSKVVGATVVNEVDETVGTIDDLIVTPGGQAPYAVLSVGGFLGLGTKYVVLPFTNLRIVDKKIILPGGTKDALKALPDFKYAS
jgi:PRC-barrel domain